MGSYYGLVFQGDAHLMNIRTAIRIGFADKEIHLSPSVPRRRYIHPYVHSAALNIVSQRLTKLYQIGKKTRTDRVGVRFQPMIVITSRGDCVDRLVKRSAHGGRPY